MQPFFHSPMKSITNGHPYFIDTLMAVAQTLTVRDIFT